MKFSSLALFLSWYKIPVHNFPLFHDTPTYTLLSLSLSLSLYFSLFLSFPPSRIFQFYSIFYNFDIKFEALMLFKDTHFLVFVRRDLISGWSFSWWIRGFFWFCSLVCLFWCNMFSVSHFFSKRAFECFVKESLVLYDVYGSDTKRHCKF